MEKRAELPWFAEGRFPLYLAPMAGYTDLPFRHLCKRYGADVMVSEFVMCEALLEGREEVWQTIEFTGFQRPMGVQIFGSDPSRMAEAARRVSDRIGPDFIDLNFGCPSEKVTNQRAGCSLLLDLDHLAAVAGAVRRAVPERPVTAKIRIGWDDDSIVAREAGRRLEEAGMEALAIHGRTKVQGYRGDADMAVITAVAAERSIPVIANGSVEDWNRIRWLKEETPCRGAMIGRAALASPWIFREIKEFLATGTPPAPWTPEKRWAVILDFARELEAFAVRDGRRSGFSWMRPRLKALTKNLPGGRQVRLAIDGMHSLAELEDLVAERTLTAASHG